MEEELVEEVDNDGGGNWRILRIWSLLDEIEFVTERNASYKKKKKKNECRKKFSDLQKLDGGYHLSEILWPCWLWFWKKNQRLELWYHFPNGKYFSIWCFQIKMVKMKKNHLDTILVAVGFDLVSSGIDFVTENNARVKRNRRQQEQFSLWCYKLIRLRYAACLLMVFFPYVKVSYRVSKLKMLQFRFWVLK